MRRIYRRRNRPRYTRERRMWANESGILQLRVLERDMRTRAAEIAGLRTEGGLSIKIRSTQNVLTLRQNKAHEGERHVTITPPREGLP
jgi:hypothetical protein